MTLGASKDRIVEMFTIITDSELNLIAEGPWAVQQPQSLLDGMDDWNQSHHSASGLLSIAAEGVSERGGSGRWPSLSNMYA